MMDPVEPFGSEKVPHHSILRLRDFPPALQDLLIVSSTAATEVGVLSRSKTALATDKPADAITGVFTTTEFLDDTRRPTLPMTDSMDDSTPVGVALDLSSKDKVYKPIPSDVELDESPSPLPGFWLLTHEGVLCSWWVVYNESIRQSTVYPGLAISESPAANVPAPSAAPFGSSPAPALGSSTPAAPAFGSSSGLGQKASPWGAPSSSTSANTGGATFGSSSFGSSPAASAPAFGKPSAIGFGQSSQLGMRSSPWAGAGQAAGGSAPAFGQSGFSSFANNANKSPFGSAVSNTGSSPATGSGGFAGFAGQSAFGSVSQNAGASIFGSGSKPNLKPFGSDSKADTAFPTKPDTSSGSVFGSTPFKLESSFKPDPAAKDDNVKPPGSSMFGNAFGSALNETAPKPTVSTPGAKDDAMDTMEAAESTPQAKPSSSIFGAPVKSPESTTPTTTPAPSKFAFASTTPSTSVFGQPSKPPSGGLFGSTQATPKPSGGLFSSSTTPKPSKGIFDSKPDPSTAGNFVNPFASIKHDAPESPSSSESGSEPGTPKVKKEEQDAPLPPDTTSKVTYPFGESSSSASSNFSDQSSGFQTKSAKAEDAPLPPDFVNVSKSKEKTTAAAREPSSPLEDAPLPPDFIAPKESSKGSFSVPSVPESTEEESDLEEGEVEDDEEDEDEEGASEEEEEEGSEGSGIDVAKDLSPETTQVIPTPGYTPQSSFGGPSGTTPATIKPEQGGGRSLFGEVNRNAPLFPRPNQISPRSPSPMRSAIPNRIMRSEASRSVSAPGMASQILGPRQSQTEAQKSASIISREKSPVEDPFLVQHRKIKARQEAEETQPLVDEEDDEVQRLLASEVEGSLVLDEFIAHANVAPPAKESIPSQVEAVYRDINSMIDTLGLNARTLKSFIKGHTEGRKEGGRNKEDLEISDDWVLCEIDELGDVLNSELYPDLEDGRVRDLDDKLDACQDIARDMHRLRAKQEDLKKMLMVKMDPDQAEATRSLPLSAEQATQQNELRREFANFSKLLAETEEALTLLKTRIATASSSSGKGNTNVPTVDAVLRTITRMTTMVEKRSGDVDVLENQLRRVHLGSGSREGSPMTTPQSRRSVMFSPDSTPVRSFRQSLAGSVSLGASIRATPPRKKLSGFSKEEKGDLMDKRARRQAVLGKLKDSVQKRGVTVWNMEDID